MVYEANMELRDRGLVIYTWGNASGIIRERGLVVIKPSGIDYGDLSEDNLCVVDMDGSMVEGNLKPSSDLPVHLEIYKGFKNIGGIAHTHSRWATVFAQAKMPIPPLGTTHADYFHGPVPCARQLDGDMIEGFYEKELGRSITGCFKDLDPLDVPAVLCPSHGPFTWGRDPKEAAFHGVVLEEVAHMAYHTLILNPVSSLDRLLLDKHFFRKHGKNSYYGQERR